MKWLLLKLNVPRSNYSLRKQQRYLLVAFLSAAFIYTLLPRLLFKTPWTYIGWKDPDFHIPDIRNGKKEMIILHWTSEWRGYDNVKVLSNNDCPYLSTSVTPLSKPSKVFDIPCRITFDRRYLKVSDALVFHSFDLLWDEVPKTRDPSQPWVYSQRECPIYTKLNLQAYHNVFNWTMTYRRDSDVYFPYGHFTDLNSISDSQSKPNKDYLEIKSQLKNRSRQIAWIVSSCDSYSKREYLMKQLQRYINIDVYGWCGMDCPSADCYSYVSRTYKFYLSFENALCKDYITEKFFSALKAGIVPVVYGGSSSSDYSAIAPKGSYIDARNFKSPKELANYLLYLDSNDDEYMKYFEWKKSLKVINSQGWCNLCQRVYEYRGLDSNNFPVNNKNGRNPVNANSVRKWYRDMWKWWNYMSYDTTVVLDEFSASAISESSYFYKLGEPACTGPLRNLTSAKTEDGTKVKLDLEPGVLNGRVFSKVAGWTKEKLFA